MSTTVKIVFQSVNGIDCNQPDIRRVNFDAGTNTLSFYDEIVKTILSVSNTKDIKRVKITYMDDADDLCTISSSDELQEALRLYRGAVLRLTIDVESSTAAAIVSKASKPAIASASDAATLAPTSTPASSVDSKTEEMKGNNNNTNNTFTNEGDSKEDQSIKLEKKNDTSSPTKDSFTDAIKALTKNSEALKQIVTFFASKACDVLESFKSDVNVSALLDEFYQACPAFANSEINTILRPFLPTVIAKVSEYAEKVKAGALSGLLDFIPTLLSNITVIDLTQSFEGDGFNKIWKFINSFVFGAAPEVKEEDYVHRSVTCDGCKMFPLRGLRFKCQTCPDYDLCSTCEQKKIHPADHVMLQVKASSPHHGFGHRHGHGGWRSRNQCGGGLFGGLGGLFKMLGPLSGLMGSSSFSAPFGGEASSFGGRPFHFGAGFGSHHGHHFGSTSEAEPESQCPRHTHGHRRHHGYGPFGGIFKAFVGMGDDENKNEQDKPWCFSRAAPFNATFVRDENLVDNSVVAPGEVLTKLWQIKNEGEQAWPFGTKLMFAHGSLAPCEILSVPLALPGETVMVGAKFQVPLIKGRHKSVFRFVVPNGARFGDRLWIDIIAKPAAPSSSTPSSSAPVSSSPAHATQTMAATPQSTSVEEKKDVVVPEKLADTKTDKKESKKAEKEAKKEAKKQAKEANEQDEKNTLKAEKQKLKEMKKAVKKAKEEKKALKAAKKLSQQDI